jgi:nitric oxide dioxygenase
MVNTTSCPFAGLAGAKPLSAAATQPLPPISTDPARKWPRELSQDTINILLATAPAVKQHGTAITSTMYRTMFSEHPEVQNLFNMTHHRVRGTEEGGAAKVSAQATTLANAVIGFAFNCDKLGNLGDAVPRMVHKHVSLNVLPEHYPIVGGCLLRAIKTVLGDAATDEIMAAWADGYWFLSDLLIDLENKQRAEYAAAAGGWWGYRDLKVSKKVVESSEIASFHLVPADGKPLVGFQAGQFLSLKFDNLHEGYSVVRNYSASCAPGLDYYRITVKRESPNATTGKPAGVVSSHLHDVIQEGSVLQVGPPCGHFYLQEKLEKPLVLLSGGVGITPLLSMTESLLESRKSANNNQPILLVQYVRNHEVLAFHDHLSQLANDHANFTYRVIAASGEAGSDGTVVSDPRGFSLDRLEGWLPSRDAEYYFCGPAGFMTAVNHALANEWEVPAAQRHYEYFGPTQDIDNPASVKTAAR